MRARRMGRPGLIGTAARTAVIAGTAQATAGAVASRQQRRANEQAQAAAAAQHVTQEPAPAPAPQPVQPAPAAAPPAAGGDLLESLERLAALHQTGALTDQEFAAAKASLLA